MTEPDTLRTTVSISAPPAPSFRRFPSRRRALMDLIDLAEGAVVPDWLIRLGMRRLMAEGLRHEAAPEGGRTRPATAAIP